MKKKPWELRSRGSLLCPLFRVSLFWAARKNRRDGGAVVRAHVRGTLEKMKMASWVMARGKKRKPRPMHAKRERKKRRGAIWV